MRSPGPDLGSRGVCPSPARVRPPARWRAGPGRRALSGTYRGGLRRRVCPHPTYTPPTTTASATITITATAAATTRIATITATTTTRVALSNTTTS